MRITKFRGLAATAITACALLATSAGAASAAPAVWNTTGSVAITPVGSFTIKAGTTPLAWNTFTCSNINNISASASTTTGVGYLSGFTFSAPQSPAGVCIDGIGGDAAVQFLSFTPIAMQGVKTGSVYTMSGLQTQYFQIIGSTNIWTSNGGAPTSYTAAWTNGTSAANPSKITFTNATIGISSVSTGYQPIKLTGTFTLKTSAGGLLTLV